MQSTPVSSVQGICDEVRRTYNSGKTKSEAYRREQLLALYNLIDENKERFIEATSKDLRKPKAEFLVTEVGVTLNDIVDALENLSTWMEPEKPSVGLINKFDNCQIRSEPFGVVLIIGAWNYPVQLTLLPMVGAIAAGNCVVLKPSELSPHTAHVIAELVPKYLDPSAFAVINGGVPETTEVLKQRFDHILYTGSSNVGKIVMAAASKYLTPVTLELGGKSPCIVDSNVDVQVAAKRIAWGKFLNCGQTCIAPDYILCNREVGSEFLRALKDAITAFYGEDPSKCPDFARMVNLRHFKRVSSLIDQKKVAFGGECNEADLYISPTVLTNVSSEDKIMQEEIFGPVLPIVNVSNTQEAIDFVNAGERPLSLYVFSNNKNVVNQVLNSTNSGGALANDVILHAAVPELPFGGVGNSGMGAYHGKHSFDLFSHKRSLMVKSLGMEFLNQPRYPPYTEQKLNRLTWLLFKTIPKGKGILFYFKLLAFVGLVGSVLKYYNYLPQLH